MKKRCLRHSNHILFNHLMLNSFIMHISLLPHSANVKFLTMVPVFYSPITSLTSSPTTPHSPFLGLSKCFFDVQPLPIQFPLPEIPVPDNGTIPSLTSFQLLLNGQFLSQRPSESYLKLYLTPAYFLLPVYGFLSSTASFAFLSSVFPPLDYKLPEGRDLVFMLWCSPRSRAVTHTWQQISQ